MNRELVFLAVVALSGCGGSSDPVSNPATSAQAGSASAASSAASDPVASTPVTIDAEGDSTMKGALWMNGAYVYANMPAPAVAQEQLIRKLGVEGITVENNGVVGETIGDDISGWAGIAPLATRLATDQSQIVMENYGLNDSIEVDLQTYHDNLVAWIAVVKQAGKIPVLEEPNPPSLTYYTQLPSFVAMVDQVGYEEQVLVIQQYNYILSLTNWQSMLTDGIHPDQALYTIKGQREAWSLQPLVAKTMVASAS
ncbi:MAG: SGNH/GDSL hydrolase family protein [Paraburkholderia sp.]|uniref:SGNH/GDSL hydrolase family protein n=1 Tax=Paraburkholderia sp. TaxID=1926495 RepID=UPI003C6BD5FF